MAQIAFVVGTIWLTFSVWSDSGMFEYVFWAGLLPATYVVCLTMLAASNPYYDEGR